MYIYTHILLVYIIIGYYKILNMHSSHIELCRAQFPVLCSRSLMVIYFIQWCEFINPKLHIPPLW